MGTATGMDPLQHTEFVACAAVAGGADLTTVAVRAPFTGAISAVNYIPLTTITGADTNTRKHEVVNKGAAGSGTNIAATLQYNNGVNATALVAKAITLSGTAANRDVVEGDVLVVNSTHVGTGIADPGGVMAITFTRD